MSENRYGIGFVVGWELTRWLVVGTSWVPGVVGIGVRWLALRWFLAESSGPFRILERVTVEFPSRLKLGRHVGINEGCWLNARGTITLGDNTILGPRCIVHSANHRFEDATTPIRQQGYNELPVHIGNDVWLGAQVTVLPGVTIGDGAVIGAGAVVTGDIPAYAVAAGVPARVLRTRGDSTEG